MKNLLIHGENKIEFKSSLEHMPLVTIICTADNQLNVIMANSKFYNYIGCDSESFNVKYRNSLMDFLNQNKECTLLIKAIANIKENGSDSIICNVKSADGTVLTTLAKGELLDGDDTDNPMISFCLIDITNYTETKKIELPSIERIANLDVLTKILNKNATIKTIDSFVKNYPDSKSCMIVINIDNFRKINELLGHYYGDEYIHKNINSLKSLIRTSDIIGRLGGDEFVIFMKNIQDKKILNQKLIEIIKLFNNKVDTEYSVIKTSCSIGISFYPQNGKTFAILYEKADKALSEAKSNGKNGYEYYSYRNNLKKKHVTEFDSNKEVRDMFKNPYKTILQMFYSSINTEKTINSIIKIIASEFGADKIVIYNFYKKAEWTTLSNMWKNNNFEKEEFSDFEIKSCKWLTNNNLLDKYNLCTISGKKEIEAIFSENNATNNENIKALVLSYAIHNGEKNAMLGLEFTENQIQLDDKRKKLLSDLTNALAPFISDKFNYDKLTNLMDRSLFNKYALFVLKNDFKSIGIIDIDINGLKSINDRYGYDAGDKAIKALAYNLNKKTSNNPIFRFSDDEFIIVYANLTFNKFMENLEFVKEGIENLHSLDVSTGYSWSDEDVDITSLQKKATEMLKVNKQNFYSNLGIENKTNANYKVFTKKNLIRFMDEGKISYKLQPQFDSKTHNIVGAEALVRFKPEELGFLTVLNFVKTLEDQNLINYIDFFVFDKVCKLLRNLKKEQYIMIPISVNFSRDSILEDNFIENIAEIVRQYDIDKKSFFIEITETVGSIKDSVIQRKISELFNLGYNISLDDFGSTYTNLSLVSMVDFNELKLDKSLISLITENKRASVMIRTIIKICNGLHIKVVAEGVETEEQLKKLTEFNCSTIQGFYFSKAISVKELKEKYMTKKEILVLSSSNENKIKEIKEILGNRYIIKSKKDVGFENFEVDEDQETLRGNAMKKAVELKNKLIGSKYENACIVADDTGLFVKALNGEPGIYSARYSGENATYDSNVDLLIQKLDGIPEKDREAYFETSIAIILPNGNRKITFGKVHGRILEERVGDSGFGYDPIFYVTSMNKSMAEMTSEEKNSISHRSVAFKKLSNLL